MVTDPIADFLIQLKNGNRAGKESVTAPASNLKQALAEVLVKAGYLKSVVKRGKKVKKYLVCELVNVGNKPKISNVKRVSKPAKRVYVKTEGLKPVRQGFGLAVISTPKGLMTNSEAKKAKLGGEILFEIW